MKCVRLPGVEILAKVSNPEKFVDGDALARKRARTTAADADRDKTPPLKRRRGDDSGSASWQHPRMNNQHEGRDAGGSNHPLWDARARCYSTNRAGYHICPDHNDGRCNRADQHNKCPKDRRSVHQCNLCLMVGHGAWETNKCPKQGGASGRGGGGGGGAPDNNPPSWRRSRSWTWWSRSWPWWCSRSASGRPPVRSC